MLETFRKYTGLMFAVLILLFIGLVFFGSSGEGVFSGPKVIVAHGRGYTAPERNRFAEKPARMLKELSGEPFGVRYQAVEPFLGQMGVIAHQGVRLTEDQVTSFLINRVILHRAMEKFGVAASTAEVEQFFKETLFWEDGAFNEAAYDDFTENNLPKLGMTVKQMNDLVGEILALQKLGEIVGAGVSVSREAVLAQYLDTTQRISYQLVAFPLSEFEEKQQPTEEELKAHWETRKAKYLSEPKRRISYLLARPDYVALEQKLYPQDESGPEGEADPSGPEGAAETPGAVEPAPPGDSKLTADDRKKALIELAVTLEGLKDELVAAKGEGFESLAADLGLEVKATELLDKESLPAELTGNLGDASNETGADLIFRQAIGLDPINAFSDIRKMGTDQWLLFRLDEVIEPAELTYEAAKEQVRRDLARESALKDMEETAKAKRAALAEALAAGKSFAEAAAELELNVTPNLDATRPQGAASPALTAFNLSARTTPGELSEVEVETSVEPDGVNRAIFTYVESREVYESPNLDIVITRQVDQERERNRRLALINWFAHQAASADVRIPAESD